MTKSLLLVMALATSTVLLPIQVRAQASAYLIASDPAYDDLDLLVSIGLTDQLIVGLRPYSYAMIERALREARERLESLDDRISGRCRRCVEALEGLEARFVREVDGPEVGGFARLRSIRAEVTAARHQAREIEGRAPGANLDATTAPLLQRNYGRRLDEGRTMAAEGVIDFMMGRYFAAQVAPRLSTAAISGLDGGPDATLLTGYLRGVWRSLAFDIGRVHALHGPTRESGAVLSSNARALSRIRVSNDRATRLPWILRHLGPLGLRFGIATMGDDRDIPGSKLITLQAAIQPARNLELGLSLLNHQGGEGAPESGGWDRLIDAFGFLLYRRPFDIWPEPQISNKLLGVDVRYRIPSAGATLYVQFASEDDHNLFADAAQGAWYNAVWVWGGRVSGLGPEGRVDVGLEAIHSGPMVYTHHQYSSGLTVNGRVLGVPLGPSGSSVDFRAKWVGPRDRLSLRATWERYSGDDFAKPPDGAGRVPVRDNPDEIRLRTELEWSRFFTSPGVRSQMRLGAERVIRFDFTDQARFNMLAQLWIEYVF